MSNWLTDSQRLLIERTFRILGNLGLALVLIGVSFVAYDEWPMKASEVGIFIIATALFCVPSVVFYSLAHFMRLGREERRGRDES